MAPRTSNFACRHDAENAPPTAKLTRAKPKTRGGIKGAHRRRRARSMGSPHRPRYAFKHAKHKNSIKSKPSLLNIEVASPPGDVVDTPDSTGSTVSMSNVTLPKYLSRPHFRGIAKETITSVAPELSDTELNYIRDGLEFLGPHMLRVLAGVKAELVSNVLPKQLAVTVNDLSCDLPTHLMAVYARDVSATTKRRVTLFPIHNIILATHCANLPILPPSDVVRPDVAGSTISVPIVPLCIPAPDVFPELSTFLYTKRIDHLLASLLPCPVPHPLYRDDPTSEHVLQLLHQFASKLATSHSAQTLLTHAVAVNGLWRNTCALGIDDKKLWCALDVAWEVLILALAVSTGKRL